MPPLGEASGSGWCLKQGERVSSMESERWGSFPTLAASACQNSNAQPTPHSYFCGRCTCFPGEFTLAMQMCFTEAIMLCCVTEHRIKQCVLMGAFLKCTPQVTVEFSDGAKSVNNDFSREEYIISSLLPQHTRVVILQNPFVLVSKVQSHTSVWL